MMEAVARDMRLERAKKLMGIEDRVEPTMLSNRTEIAIAINYGFWPVLAVDLDAPQEYSDYHLFGMCRLWHRTPLHPERDPYYVKGQLACEKGKFSIKGFGAMLTKDFSAADFCDMVRESAYPKIEPGGIVALAFFSQKLDCKFVTFKRVSKHTDTGCITMAQLEDLAVDEMESEVDSRINKVLMEF